MKARLFGLLAIFAATASLAGEPSGGVTWYSIVTDGGTAIGYASQEIVQGPQGREIIDIQSVSVGEQAEPSRLLERVNPSTTQSWRTVLREDAAGRTVSISSQAKIGRGWTRHDAVIVPGKAVITKTTPSETRVTTLALPQDVRFDMGEDLLPAWNPVTTPRLEFENFNLEAMEVERVVFEAVPSALPGPDGRTPVLRKRYEGRELRAVARLLIDGQGRIAQVTQPMFGTSIVIKMTDKGTALKAHGTYRMLSKVMMKSPFRISAAAVRGHIRYRFAFRDGIAFDLPQTGEQRLAAGPDLATVDICDSCGPGLPTDAATLADALKPTAWLQSDHPKLKAIADPVAKLPISDTRKMEMLLKKARPYLGRIDFTGHYSALETLERRSGDCTEAAVLLAALGRAAGIPTRVVNGLVYSRESYHGISNAFMPHSWTLAFADGKWRSFDLALDVFDSTHVALTVGDGDERSVLAAGQLASLLRWEGMSEVKTPPAN